MKKPLVLFIISILIVSAASFFGGMKYAAAKRPGGARNFANLTPEQMQNRFAQGGVASQGTFQRGARGGNGGFIAGEVISKDEKSITIKLGDGGSKIIFVSDSAKIMKAVSGTKDDIGAGVQVTVTGEANSDGSINAQNIQIRQ